MNNPPVLGGDLSITVAEGATVTLTTADLTATDADNADAQLVYTLTGTSRGAILLSGAPTSTFTQADLAAGHVAFQHDGSETTSASLTVSLTDGSAAPQPATVDAAVTPANDAPHVTVPASYTFSDILPFAISGITFSDVDAGATNELATFHVGNGTLVAASGGGVTVGGSGTANVTLTGSLANLNAFVAGDNLSYVGLQDTTLSVTIDDQGHTGLGGSLMDSANVPIAIQPFPPPPNHPPVNHLTGPFLTQSDTDFAIAGFSVSDDDAGLGTLSTTLSVAHGTLTVAPAGGAAVSGSGTGAVTLSGTAAAINTTLAAFHNVVYHGTAHFVGFDVLTMTTNDNGNAGAGGPQADIDSVGIQVEPLAAGGGDFNGDHAGDYLLRRDDGTFRIDEIGSNHVNAVVLGNVGNEWQFYGAGDFNGDGISDYLLQRDGDGMLQFEEVGSNRVAAHAFLGPVGSEWHIRSIGDFNGDHTSDILWQRDDGLLRVYGVDNYQIVATPFLGAVGAEWHFTGAGDFNGDGTSDILWQRDDGTLRIYDIGNNQVTATQTLGPIGPEWHLAGIGDFNGDHTDDLLWQRNDGTLRIYDIVNNQVAATQTVETLAADTHVVGFGDYNADGTSDLLLRHDDGTFQLQLIHANLVTQTVSLGQVGNEWHII